MISSNRKEDLFERIDANQCNVCGYTPEELGKEKHYAYSCGHYCSKECYDTLFDICDVCGELNMTVVSNENNGKGKICDACYDKEHNLSVVTIVYRGRK